jgi:hypothetical protein
MGQAEGGSFMNLDRRPISLAVSKRFSEPLFQPHTNQRHQPQAFHCNWRTRLESLDFEFTSHYLLPDLCLHRRMSTVFGIELQTSLESRNRVPGGCCPHHTHLHLQGRPCQLTCSVELAHEVGVYSLSGWAGGFLIILPQLDQDELAEKEM